MISGMDTPMHAKAAKTLLAEGYNPYDPLVQAAYAAATEIFAEVYREWTQNNDVRETGLSETDQARQCAEWTLIIIRRVPAFQRQ